MSDSICIHYGWDDEEEAPVILCGGKADCIDNAKDQGGVVYEYVGEAVTGEGTMLWPEGE